MDQSRDWTSGPTGVPSGLRHQIKKICAKKGIVKDSAFGQNGEWFCKSRLPDASGDLIVWDVPTEECSDFLANHFHAKHNDHFLVCFGPNLSYCVVDGYSRTYLVSKNSPYSLKQRLSALFQNPNGVIYALSLFRNGGYFILDSIGCFVESGPTAIQDELMGSSPSIPADASQVVNVTVSGDNNWIITKRHSYVASTGVCRNLVSKLHEYYKTFNNRNKNLAERALMEQQIMREMEMNDTNSTEHMRTQRNQTAKLKKQAVIRTKRARQKGLKLGSVVTAVGFSTAPADSVITDVRAGGILVLAKLNDPSDKIELDDPRKLCLTPIEEYPTQQIVNLVKSVDKFEAAVARFPCRLCLGPSACECPNAELGIILTRQSSDTSASTRSTKENVDEGVDPNSQPSPDKKNPELTDDDMSLMTDDSKHMSTNEPMDRTKILSLLNHGPKPTAANPQYVPFAPIFEEYGEYLPFNEYKCAEKIDLRRLQLILEDLKTDKNERRTAMISLMRRRRKSSASSSSSHNNNNNAAMLRRLQRCRELECIAESLYSILKEYPISEDLCVVHEVNYKHRDKFSRGRLFGVGKTVQAVGSRLSRNTTLQSMHPDWRIPLVGAFSYYVDCQNSQVRTLCCLAKQLNLTHLIPNFIEYRDNRATWVARISSLHKVTEEAAKRWPNIIIGGGLYVYKTWLHGLNANDTEIQYVKSFAHELATEIAAFVDELLVHPRFQWACSDQQELRMEDCSEFTIKTRILSRVLESCENEILTLLQRSFHLQGWITRSKIFDSLIVEKGPTAHKNLPDVLDTAENACKMQGWDVVLVEKDLNGKEDRPIKTVEEARQVLRELSIGTSESKRKSRSKAKRMASGFDVDDIE